MLNLKKIREEKKLTQNELATKLNIARTTYIGYENGTRTMSYEKLKQLATILQVSIDEILDFKLDKKTSTKKTQLIDKINRLTESECEKIDFFVQTILTNRQRTYERDDE